MLFVFVDWCFRGRTYQKILTYVDDFVDEKIEDVKNVILENESFIVLDSGPPQPNDEDEE